MKRAGFAKWLALAAALAVVLPAAAQVNTGTVEVVTLDQQGASLPGVTVQVRNTDTGLQRIAVAGASGISSFAALPPGPYAVGADLEGFASITGQQVVLRIGQTARLEFRMQVQVSETITVTAELPMVDVLKTDSSTNITPEQIENLPVADRQFERLAFITPGVQRERGTFRFIQDSPVVGAGGNASQTSIQVDGVDFTDQVNGLARARFSQDAIREFRVIASRFDSEIGGSQGGALSVVTKSGTNEVHGSVYGFYRDDSMRDKKEVDAEKTPYERYQVGATIGGPLARDKTHYFLALEYIDTADVTRFRPGGAFADLAADYDLPIQQTLASLSLDHQFGASANGFLKGMFEQYRLDNYRVGGVNDESNGQSLDRDNWNIVLGHTAVFGDGSRLNEARFQYGNRDFEEPLNSRDTEEWFSSGNTLKIGANTIGDLIGYGSYWELRDTFHLQASSDRTTHDWKFGGAVFYVEERSRIDTYQEGLMIYADDTRLFPLVYTYGRGSSDITTDTYILSGFIQDDWRVRPNFTLSLGLRYDYDTDGNNPDFADSPMVGPRGVDENNFQPRVGFSWDINNNGKSVLRGGAGIFVGRYLLVPSIQELQQNGTTGWFVQQNFNGLFLGLPPAYWLDPANPENTGIPLAPSVLLMEDNLKAPETWQASLGFTRRLGNSGLYFDLEGLYAKGDNEFYNLDTNWGGNDNPVRLDPAYSAINVRSNTGHSEYTAVVASLNGTFGAGHMLTSSVTWADKKNLSDDFTPQFPVGYPNDSADPEAEWGRSRSDERLHFVVSTVLNLPANFLISGTWQYGDGQPWNHLLGYDYNGDLFASDRPEGVARNSVDGPSFNELSLRLSWAAQLGGAAELELIAEVFNALNTTNWDVTSVVAGEFLSGPTLANPTLPYVPNVRFGEYLDTLRPREFQFGARLKF
jgi:hypothetical protein